MKSIKFTPNTAYKQLMATGTQGNRSNYWLLAQTKGNEVGEVIRKPYASLKRATTAWRKLIQKHGKDSGWVIITSDRLGQYGFVWL